MDTSIVVSTIITAVILPFVVSFLKGQQWSSNIKFLFSMAVAVLASGAQLLAQNDFEWDVLVAQSATIWAGAQIIYQTWFKNTNTETKLSEALPWSKEQ